MEDEVKLRFRWDGEEGVVVGKDIQCVLNADWIVAADFLVDVIRIAESLYAQVLSNKNGASRGG